MVDLNDMIYFAEVAERGGFTAAGRALGIPKSRLSRRVALLETELGVQLLQRSTRSLSLTRAGELYLRHCAAMRDAAQAAGEAVAQVQTEPRGTIRISCPVTLAQSSLGRLLPAFMSRYPAVRVEMMVINRPVDPVEEGVDIALRVRSVIEDSATLVAKNFGVTRGLLVANSEWVRLRGPIERPVLTPHPQWRVGRVAARLGATTGHLPCDVSGAPGAGAGGAQADRLPGRKPRRRPGSCGTHLSFQPEAEVTCR
jgi:DNA-binding transcriptional LysR family regulator